MKNTKKTLVRVLSVCMALITMLLASVMPVSAAYYIVPRRSVNDSLGNELIATYAVTFTPGTSPSTSTYESVNGGAILNTGSTLPTNHCVYLVVFVGAWYIGDAYQYYNKGGWRRIEDIAVNRSYNALDWSTRGGEFVYYVATDPEPRFFLNKTMLSFTKNYVMNDCVNGLYTEHRIQAYDVYHETVD